LVFKKSLCTQPESMPVLICTNWKAIAVEVSAFKRKWGFTQEEIAILMRTSRSTITHWLAEGKHDAGRSGSPSAQMCLEFWDLILTLWLENDRRYPQEHAVFLAAKKRGKGDIWRSPTSSQTSQLPLE
jgi:hypothetical protein